MPYNIAFIGAGKLTHSFLPALAEAGHKLTALISRNLLSTKKLSSKYDITVSSDNLSDIPANTNVIIIAVPDAVIRATASQLTNAMNNLKNKLVIHCSGAASSDQMDSLEKRGAIVGSFHIMQTFPSIKRVKLDGCYAAIESRDERALKILKRIATDADLKPFVISPEEKLLYHLTGVYASNFLAANLAAAERIYAGINMEKPAMTEVIAQIIKTTLKNIKNSGAVKSISGPAARGDLNTIKAHIRVLKKKNKQELHSYIVQSLAVLTSIESVGTDLPENHKAVKNYLEKELTSLLQ